MSMTIKDDRGYWFDGMGEAKPEAWLDKYIPLREKLVDEMIEEALAMEQMLSEFRELSMKKLYGRLSEIYEETGVQLRKTRQGSFSITNHSKTVKISIGQGTAVMFDERLMVAQTLLEEYIEEISEGASNSLKDLILSVFKENKNGNIDKTALLSLRKKHTPTDFNPKWHKAMDLIIESMEHYKTKQYLRFEYKKREDEHFRRVKLSLSQV